MSPPRLTKVPPDGGWGWLVVLGSSIVNMFTRAIEPSFGLLFKDLLTELKMETTGAAVVMGTMDSMINFSGLFVGPLMKAMSYRKVALMGAALTATAYLLTITANSMAHLVISFSIIGGMGFGFSNASTFVGLNSYFDKRKAQAVGLAMAGTAVGFMIMPQIVSYLLIHYQFRGTLVIMTALTLNTFVGASLFQPVKWHTKTVETKVDKEEKALLADHVIREEDEDEERMVQSVVSEENERKNALATSASSLPKPTLSLTHINSLNQMNSMNPASSICAIRRQTSLVASLKPLEQRKLTQVASSASLRRRPSMMSHVSLLDFAGSTMHIDYQDDADDGLEMKISHKPDKTAKKKQPGVFSRIAKIMDLNLLKDAIYLNILYGSSINYVSEFSWKLILPFFMYDLGYDLQQTATALSVMSIADLAARVVMPPVLDRLPYSRRATTTAFLALLAVARSSVAMQTETIPLMVTLIIHAFIRGVTLIGFPLVLSEYANKDNFPAVLGLSMVAKGIFIAAMAPIIGWVRDYSGSYAFTIHFQSIMIVSCVTAWTIESAIVRKKDDDDLSR